MSRCSPEAPATARLYCAAILRSSVASPGSPQTVISPLVRALAQLKLGRAVAGADETEGGGVAGALGCDVGGPSGVGSTGATWFPVTPVSGGATGSATRASVAS